MKKNNGITMMTLVLTIMLIMLVSGTIGYYATKSLKIQNIKNMYSDIDVLEAKIDQYYIKNKELPILSNKINFEDFENPNDETNEYFIIDLAKLGNLNLNYGKDFETVKDNGTEENHSDVYILNAKSQTIYYLKGISFEDKNYYSKPIEYTKIN